MDNLPFSNIDDRPETLKYLEDLKMSTEFVTLKENYYEQLRAVLNYGPRSKDGNKSECPLLEDVFVGTYLDLVDAVVLKDFNNTPDEIKDLFFNLTSLAPATYISGNTKYTMNDEEFHVFKPVSSLVNPSLMQSMSDYAVRHKWVSYSHFPIDAYIKAPLQEVTELPEHLHDSLYGYREDLKDYILSYLEVQSNFYNLVTGELLMPDHLQQGAKLKFLETPRGAEV